MHYVQHGSRRDRRYRNQDTLMITLNEHVIKRTSGLTAWLVVEKLEELRRARQRMYFTLLIVALAGIAIGVHLARIAAICR